MTSVLLKLIPDTANPKRLLFFWCLFHLPVCMLLFQVPDPVTYFLLLLTAITLAFFLFQVDNYHEIIALLGLVFCIELLYSGLGSLALFGMYGLVLLLLLARTAMQGVADWQNALFTKELLLFIGVALLSLFWGEYVLNGIRLFSINLAMGLVLFYITHFICADRRSFFYITLFLILILLANGIYGISVFITSGDRARSLFIRATFSVRVSASRRRFILHRHLPGSRSCWSAS
jgi:hypothetical protein